MSSGIGILPAIVTFEFPSSKEAARFFTRTTGVLAISYRVVEVAQVFEPLEAVVAAAKALGGRVVS